MITLDQAKSLQYGTILYSTLHTDSKGYPRQWRVTSVKTWKTRPNEVLIGLKFGLYDHDKIDQNELGLVTLDADQPRLIWLERNLSVLRAQEERTTDKRTRSTLRRQITKMEEERARLQAPESQSA